MIGRPFCSTLEATTSLTTIFLFSLLKMYLTALLWVLFSAMFAIVFYRKAKNQFVIKLEVDRSDYESDGGGDYQMQQDDVPKTTSATV